MESFFVYNLVISQYFNLYIFARSWEEVNILYAIYKGSFMIAETASAKYLKQPD